MMRGLVVPALIALVVVAEAPAAPLGEVTDRAALRRSLAPTNADYDSYVDANRLLMFNTNVGSFAYDNSGVAGLYFPRGTALTAIYAAGLWLGAKVNDELRVSVAEYDFSYEPGPMVGGASAPDDPSFKVYKIIKNLKQSGFYDGPRPVGDPGQQELWDDYHNWPAALGAPVDEVGNPKFIGDQTLWCVFNDDTPSLYPAAPATLTGLGVEIQHTVFAFDRTDDLGNCIFMRYLIINESGSGLDSVYVGFWADPDIGEAVDDYAGCDTILDLGYAYNADGEDQLYGATPPAVGFQLLSGPLAPSPGDSALFMGEWRHDFSRLPMTAFTRYFLSLDPFSPEESFWYLQGRDAKNGGDPIINPVTGLPTPFMLSGDPVSQSGWVDYAIRLVQHLDIDILEVAGPGGIPVVPPEDVANSWNSTNEWYVTSDQGDNWDRLNWRGLIGTDTWEFRFTPGGSEYYDWNSDEKWPNRAPFEAWNLGPEKPNDPGNDRRIQFTILDDDGSGGWTSGDRIYLNERTYAEPLPAIMEYTYPDDFHLGRVKFNESIPQSGTKVQFVSYGIFDVDTLFGQDCRYMLATGPFDMAAGDSQEVVIAVIVGQSGAVSAFAGQTAAPGVTELKETAARLPAMLMPDFNICVCLNTGDLNNNGIAAEPADVVFMVNYLFRGGKTPPSDPDCPLVNRADFTCDGKTNTVDLVRLVNLVYRYPAAPPCDPCRR